jgi:hypothetical protein
VGPAVEPAVNDPFLCSVPNSRFDSHTSSHKFSRTLHAHCRHRPTTSTIRPLAVSTIRKQRQSRAGTVHCSTATFFFVQVPGVTLQHNTTQHKVAPGSYQRPVAALAQPKGRLWLVFVHGDIILGFRCVWLGKRNVTAWTCSVRNEDMWILALSLDATQLSSIPCTTMIMT